MVIIRKRATTIVSTMETIACVAKLILKETMRLIVAITAVMPDAMKAFRVCLLIVISSGDICFEL